ncbi:protein-ADP-ribose hydrolase [Bifidobacterium sp. 6T3]|uniref:Protein-ADP-ribose hydrolase n=2 Tax=Bifidobacterium phasiani TaxID=2834431 RepID=A0ABS6W6L7_9BIFI|nr:protein-ADP-ribose hydrolase [Bifidobacterium phasiani]
MTTMTTDERLALCARLVNQLTRERTDACRPLPFPASTADRPDAAATFGPDDPTGRTFAQQWHRLRALVNTREPATPPDGFTDAQDRLLRDLIANHGITDVATIPVTPADPRIAVWRGDITTLAADAIVNAANSGMTGCWSPLHSCIDNAIHTFAGIRLRDECARYMAGRNWAPEPTGRAMVTDAYDLPARHVVHTVGPIANGRPTDEHRDQLASCYRSCLDAAARAGDRSIGLCCISTGVFGFPQDQAADIAAATVRDWLDRHADTPMRVVFVTFTERDEALYRRLFGAPARGAGGGHVPPAPDSPGSDAAIRHAHNVSLPDSSALPDTSDSTSADSTSSVISTNSVNPTDSADSDAPGPANPAGPADSGNAPYTRHTATDPLRSARDLLADADRVIIGAAYPAEHGPDHDAADAGVADACAGIGDPDRGGHRRCAAGAAALSRWTNKRSQAAIRPVSPVPCFGLSPIPHQSRTQAGQTAGQQPGSRPRMDSGDNVKTTHHTTSRTHVRQRRRKRRHHATSHADDGALTPW